MTAPPLAKPDGPVVTPPTQPVPQPKIYIGMTIFGWLTAAGGGAFLYSQRTTETVWSMGAGIALVLFGGTCINRDPVRIFLQSVAGVISAWRSGHGDHE